MTATGAARTTLRWQIDRATMSGMKVVVACAKCCRRYNAAGRPVGARFRCHCGESLTVSAPRGHDAAVVRCSSCGAPRENKADACQHCGSDFTLHERDLHSVCPACLARVSDKARYCHHCAALAKTFLKDPESFVEKIVKKIR